ncbi:hypothetical protein Dimus_005905, partial [Dionaea muscipula]
MSHTTGHISYYITDEEESPVVFTGDTLFVAGYENERVKEKLSWAQHQREADLPSIPSTIEEELEINPFMWVDLPETP